MRISDWSSDVCSSDLATVETVRELFETEWPTSAAVYLRGGRAPQPGALVANPAMADTYARIVEEAEAGGGSREAVLERARAIWARGVGRASWREQEGPYG